MFPYCSDTLLYRDNYVLLLFDWYKILKILIVDDEYAIRLAFQRIFEAEGHDVSICANYVSALEYLEDADLVLTDIVLGAHTGIDLLKQIHDRKLACPVIIISGHPSLETAQTALRLGAFDYLTKPIQRDDLLKAARQALRQKGLEDEKERYRTHLETLFGSVRDAIVTVDEKLQVVTRNPAAGRLCGIPENWTGQALAPTQGDCAGGCLPALQEAMQSGEHREIHRMECHRTGRSGQVVSITASPLPGRGRKSGGAVLVARDETRLDALEKNLSSGRLHRLIGASPAMQAIYPQIENLAEYDTTVLIFGESGTGKELAAEALHYCGGRRDKPLIKVNCAAIPENLLASELFGHVRGAFTGAIKDKIGRFQQADGGTIFLDEIGEIPPALQVTLLRVLQDKEIERVGDSRPIRVNIRIIAATNCNLREKVRKGEFREDLYYRLKVAELHMPPLRERRDDIHLLAAHFLNQFTLHHGKAGKRLSSDAIAAIRGYHWPGNVRELQHALEQAFVTCQQDTITAANLPQTVREAARRGPPPGRQGDSEATRILEALRQAGWNKAKAARQLGMGRATLYRKMAELGMSQDKDSL